MTNFKLNRGEIDLFENFFHRTKAAIIEADHMKNPNWLGRRLTYKQFLARFCGDDFARRFVRAANGVTWLQSEDYKILVDQIFQPYCTAVTYLSVSSHYEIYKKVQSYFNAKRNPYWGTNYISGKNVLSYFDKLLNDSGFTIDSIIADEKNYIKFIDATVEHPACNNSQGEAITSGYVISEYLRYQWSQPNQGTLKKLNPTSFPGYLSVVARTAGWAAQKVGQRSKFEYFLNIAKQQAATHDRHSIICYYMLLRHDQRWLISIGREPDKTGAARIAHQAWRDLPSGHFSFIEDYDSTLQVNPVDELVGLGAGIESKVDFMMDRSIRNILRDASENFDANSSYNASSLINIHNIKARAYLNESTIKSLYYALEEVDTGMDLINEQEISDTSPHMLEILFTKGLIRQRTTKIIENNSLIQARSIAVSMGAFHRARLIERALGWR